MNDEIKEKLEPMELNRFAFSLGLFMGNYCDCLMEDSLEELGFSAVDYQILKEKLYLLRNCFL